MGFVAASCAQTSHSAEIPIALAARSRHPGGVVAARVAGSVAGAAIRAGRYSIPAQRGLTAADYDVRIYSATLPPQPTDGGRSGDAAPGRGLPPGVEQIPVEYGSETKQRVRVGRGLRNVFDFDMPLRSSPPAGSASAGGPQSRS